MMYRRLENTLPADFHFPQDLEGMGYFFNAKDQIRMISDPSQGFNYNASKNERYVQRQREAMDDQYRRIIRERHIAQGLQLTPLPLGTLEDKPHVPVFASKHLSVCKQVIVYFGESHQDLGLLAGRVINTETFNAGTTIPFVKYAHQLSAGALCEEAKPGIIIANPGQLLWNRRAKTALTWRSWYARPRKTAVSGGFEVTEANFIPRNRDVAEHVRCVLEDLVYPLPDDCQVFVIAAGDTAHEVFDHLQRDWEKCKNKVQALAILASNYVWQTTFERHDFQEWFGRRARAYMVSQDSQGTPLQGRSHMGCNLYASGEMEFVECVMVRAADMILDYFKMITIMPDFENAPQDFVVEQPAEGDKGWDDEAAIQHSDGEAIIDQSTTTFLKEPPDICNDKKDLAIDRTSTMLLQSADTQGSALQSRKHAKNGEHGINAQQIGVDVPQYVVNNTLQPNVPLHGLDGPDERASIDSEASRSSYQERSQTSTGALSREGNDRTGMSEQPAGRGDQSDREASNEYDSYRDCASQSANQRAPRASVDVSSYDVVSGDCTPQTPAVPHSTPELGTPATQSSPLTQPISPSSVIENERTRIHRSINAATDALRRTAISRGRAWSGSSSCAGDGSEQPRTFSSMVIMSGQGPTEAADTQIPAPNVNRNTSTEPSHVDAAFHQAVGIDSTFDGHSEGEDAEVAGYDSDDVIEPLFPDSDDEDFRRRHTSLTRANGRAAPQQNGARLPGPPSFGGDGTDELDMDEATFRLFEEGRLLEAAESFQRHIWSEIRASQARKSAGVGCNAESRRMRTSSGQALQPEPDSSLGLSLKNGSIAPSNGPPQISPSTRSIVAPESLGPRSDRATVDSNEGVPGQMVLPRSVPSKSTVPEQVFRDHVARARAHSGQLSSITLTSAPPGKQEPAQQSSK